MNSRIFLKLSLIMDQCFLIMLVIPKLCSLYVEIKGILLCFVTAATGCKICCLSTFHAQVIFSGSPLFFFNWLPSAVKTTQACHHCQQFYVPSKIYYREVTIFLGWLLPKFNGVFLSVGLIYNLICNALILIDTIVSRNCIWVLESESVNMKIL